MTVREFITLADRVRFYILWNAAVQRNARLRTANTVR